MRYQIRSYKLADLAGPQKSKKEQKSAKRPENTTGTRYTVPGEKKLRNHSCVPFNLEDVLENSKKKPNPTMVHPEDSGNFMQVQNVLLPVKFVVNPCCLADLQ